MEKSRNRGLRGSKQRESKVAKIRERDGDNCHICGKIIDFTITDFAKNDLAVSSDHFTPVSDGGSNHIDNLRLSHRICNTSRGNGHDHEDLIAHRKADDIKYAQVREEARLRKEAKMVSINGHN